MVHSWNSNVGELNCSEIVVKYILDVQPSEIFSNPSLQDHNKEMLEDDFFYFHKLMIKEGKSCVFYNILLYYVLIKCHV